MASDDHKLKLMHLIRILEEETDDEHRRRVQGVPAGRGSGVRGFDPR